MNTKPTTSPDPAYTSEAQPQLRPQAASSLHSPRFKAQAQAQAPRRLASRDLLGAAQEVQIDHDGAIYRLRCTAQGKLILTK